MDVSTQMSKFVAIVALSVLLYGCEFRFSVNSTPIVPFGVGTKVQDKTGGPVMEVVSRNPVLPDSVVVGWTDTEGHYRSKATDVSKLEQR